MKRRNLELWILFRFWEFSAAFMAQLVERSAVNRQVLGSIPSGGVFFQYSFHCYYFCLFSLPLLSLLLLLLLLLLPLIPDQNYLRKDFGSMHVRVTWKTHIADFRCKMGLWSSGMILASGARGRGFDSPQAPSNLLFECKISMLINNLDTVAEWLRR